MQYFAILFGITIAFGSNTAHSIWQLLTVEMPVIAG